MGASDGNGSGAGGLVSQTQLSPEIVARLAQALRSQPAAQEPSSYARPVYDVLVEHGLGRSDLLAVAASLLDLVAADPGRSRHGSS